MTPATLTIQRDGSTRLEWHRLAPITRTYTYDTPAGEIMVDIFRFGLWPVYLERDTDAINPRWEREDPAKPDERDDGLHAADLPNLDERDRQAYFESQR